MIGSLIAIVNADSILQFFISWEIMTVSSYLLISRGKDSEGASFKYIMFSLGGAFLILLGFGYAFSNSYTLNYSIFALAGDYIIFRFFKDNLANDVAYALKASKYSHLKGIFHLRIFSWLAPLLGAIIIASPISDSVGLALMGLSKTRSIVFVPISFALHFLGIATVGLVAKQFV